MEEHKPEKLNINEEQEFRVQRLERDRLELEKLRRENAEARLAEEKIVRNREAQRKAALSKQLNQKRIQQLCPHRTGGEGMFALTNGGDDANFCFVRHTYSTGVTHVLCQRCGKEWKPGDENYDWAMTAPTKYSPRASSAVQFSFSRLPAKV